MRGEKNAWLSRVRPRAHALAAEYIEGRLHASRANGGGAYAPFAPPPLATYTGLHEDSDS